MSRWGIRLIVVGALAQAAGLVVDVWLHVDDPTLAAREALLTFDNLGHVLLNGGIALVLAGVGVLLAGARVARARPVFRLGIPLVLALLMGSAGIAAANSSLARGHEHGEKAPSAAHGHGHGESDAAYAPLGAKTRTTLSDELTEARDVAERFATVKDAEAAGYRAVTTYLPLIGAHYMKFLTVDGTFDITQPEMLLYDGTKPGSKIVGLSYYVVARSEPEGFAGPNDHWHRHLGLCIDTANPFVLGDEQTTEAECERRGGRKADGADGWMVHAWVVPGWDSPRGVFSAENAQLT
jgi:hypothetical protein